MEYGRNVFIYLFIFIILVSALKNESRETHAKNSSCCPLPGLYGWLGSYCSFSRKLPPSLPFAHFITLPFPFAPLSIPNLLPCHWPHQLLLSPEIHLKYLPSSEDPFQVDFGDLNNSQFVFNINDSLRSHPG
jgi:hypothetical protein